MIRTPSPITQILIREINEVKSLLKDVKEQMDKLDFHEEHKKKETKR